MKKLFLIISAVFSVYGKADTLDISGLNQENASGDNVPVVITGVAANELLFTSATPGLFTSRVIATTDLPSSIPLNKLAVDPLDRANHNGSQSWETISGEPDFQLADERLDEVVDGVFLAQPEFRGGYKITGPTNAPMEAMTGTSMDLSKNGQTYTVTADATLGWLGTEAYGIFYRLNLVDSGAGPHTVTLPLAYVIDGQGNLDSLTSVVVPLNGVVSLIYWKDTDRWIVWGAPIGITGTGNYVLDNGPTIQNLITNYLVYGASWNGSYRVPTMDAVFDAIEAISVGSGANDVTAAAAFTNDNRLLRSDGTGRGAQASAIIVDDSGNVSGVTSLSTGTLDTTNLIAGNLQFEGTTPDANQTRITVTDPTADRLWNIPNLPDTDFVGTAATQTLTNKGISGSTNTLTNIPLTTAVTGLLPVANGGTGTATPSLVAGSNVTITGTWPNQTVAASGGGSSPSFTEYRQNPPILWEDYHAPLKSTSVPQGDFGFIMEGSGDTLGTPIAGSTTTPGQMQLYTGTGTTNYRGAISGGVAAGNILFGGGSYDLIHSFFPGQASDGSGTYGLRFGFVDSVSSTEPTDGVYFRCSGVSPVNWFAVCRSNNTETAVDTTVAAATSGRVTLRAVVNAAANEALFYINDTLVATITTNIPSGSGRNTAVGYAIIKSAGASDRFITMDYSGLKIALTSSR